MAVAHIDYERFFTRYERKILSQISEKMKEKCGKIDRVSIEKFLFS